MILECVLWTEPSFLIVIPMTIRKLGLIHKLPIVTH